MRHCPFIGCARRIPAHLFACAPHWFKLNGPQKAEIHAAYGCYKADEIGPDELRRRQQVVLDQVAPGSTA